MIATAYVKTSTPSKYINRLCKHFTHKVSVEYDDNQGKIDFTNGTGYIEKTEDGLKLVSEATNSEYLEEIIDIMDRHFVRVAWQEEITLDWTKNN